MRVTVDEQNYITGWNVADGDDGLPCAVPEDFEHFMSFYPAYKYSDGIASLDTSKLPSLETQRRQNEIRTQRDAECFPFINRGPLWYAKLAESQIAEMNTWYNAWLDAPETGIVPEAPSWLK